MYLGFFTAGAPSGNGRPGVTLDNGAFVGNTLRYNYTLNSDYTSSPAKGTLILNKQ